MTNTKHTPGKWADIKGYIVCKTGYTIASVNSHNTDEGKANARLIAAAPELLEALKATTEWIVDLAASGDAGFWDGEKMDEVISARAAIAKAEGR